MLCTGDTYVYRYSCTWICVGVCTGKREPLRNVAKFPGDPKECSNCLLGKQVSFWSSWDTPSSLHLRDSRWLSRGGKRCITPQGSRHCSYRAFKTTRQSSRRSWVRHCLTTKLESGGWGPTRDLTSQSWNLMFTAQNRSECSLMTADSRTIHTCPKHSLQEPRLFGYSGSHEALSAQLEFWWALHGSVSSWAALLMPSQKVLDCCCVMFVLFNGFKIHFTLFLLTLSLAILWIFEAIISRLFLLTFEGCLLPGYTCAGSWLWLWCPASLQNSLVLTASWWSPWDFL